MSLYNTVCGNNPLYLIWLAMAGVKFDDIPRFRDVYLDIDGKYPMIVVYTRTGGGNRESYELQNEAMRNNPLFVNDWDDGFDSTFAHFAYKVPEKYVEKIKFIQGILKNYPKFIKPEEKFKLALANIAKEQLPTDIKDEMQKEVAPLDDMMAKKLHDELNELVKDFALDVTKN